MCKERGADLYWRGEGMRLYNLCAFPSMFGLASLYVRPMPILNE